MKRIREAKRVLEARAKAEAAAEGQPSDAVKPDPKAQYNFTDPESRIMKGPDGFVQAYNVQVAVNAQQLIVGQAVTQETNDKKQLIPMITIIEEQSGDTPTQLLADAGHCSDANLAAITDTPIDAYISTRKQKHGERPGRPGPCPRGPLPTTATRCAVRSSGSGMSTSRSMGRGRCGGSCAAKATAWPGARSNA